MNYEERLLRLLLLLSFLVMGAGISHAYFGRPYIEDAIRRDNYGQPVRYRPPLKFHVILIWIFQFVFFLFAYLSFAE